MIELKLEDLLITEKQFLFKEGIYDFIAKKKNLHNITEKVAEFYEDEPFPNYDKVFSRDKLSKAAELTKFPKSINNILKDDCKVLELGCGTGQLTNYLGIGKNRTIVGLDLSYNSLRIAEDFRTKASINNTKFIRADILDLPFKENQFDLVVANGVLHHTRDTWLSLSKASKMIAPNGLIIIGLYNKFGRWRTNLTRFFSTKIGLKTIKFLDPLVGKIKKGENEIRSWINDQYFHPVERSHTFDELLNETKKLNLQPIRILPDVKNYDVEEDLSLTEYRSIGNKIDRLICQIIMGVIDNSDGGLFVGVFQKNEN